MGKRSGNIHQRIDEFVWHRRWSIQKIRRYFFKESPRSYDDPDYQDSLLGWIVVVFGIPAFLILCSVFVWDAYNTPYFFNPNDPWSGGGKWDAIMVAPCLSFGLVMFGTFFLFFLAKILVYFFVIFVGFFLELLDKVNKFLWRSRP